MKTFLKGIIFALILVLIFNPSISSLKANAATSLTEKAESELDSLDNYLNDYSTNTAEKSGVTGMTNQEIEKDVSSIKKQIDDLSTEKKEKLAYYLSNPAALQKALEDENNNDVVLEEEMDQPPVNLYSVTSTRNATYSYTMKLFKIKMTKYVVSVKYQTSGGRVKKIVASSGYLDKNYNPIVRTARIQKTAWIANNRAKTTSRFSYSLINKSYGIQIGTVTLHVEGTSGGARYNGYAKLS
ncbi:hypothetical protein [Listeria seeligeri]|uniref:hypothetical protein n=1 Tax=Listeria seeligeri TaxID=1640 RepID=UPI0016281B18|nr:hypothetical protein [Listeria seeligeri]MBC1746884.1 hypothetical protein [Listeria seeligeri]MBC2233023.1 hypothetical protein [Listeria seeligeri]MBF2626147.1 hypothetical protein [Listeria seeligeri]MBF2673459.1 hypothetical protein [Listeria seeligeri]